MNNNKTTRLNNYLTANNNNETPLNEQFQKIINWSYVLIIHGILYVIFVSLFLVAISWMSDHTHHHEWLPLFIASICCHIINCVFGAIIGLHIVNLARALPIKSTYKINIINLGKNVYFLNFLAIPTFILIYKTNKLKKEDPTKLLEKENNTETSLIDSNNIHNQ